MHQIIFPKKKGVISWSKYKISSTNCIKSAVLSKLNKTKTARFLILFYHTSS